MKCLLIQKNKVIKILEWFLFISFCCVSVYFASGVVKQFMSEKTSFSQHEEKFPYYPVVSILFPFEASKVNLTNVEIKYMPTGRLMDLRFEVTRRGIRSERANEIQL